MNEKIKELVGQSYETRPLAPSMFNEEKFAELIIRECIKVSEAHAKSLEAQPCDPEFSLYVDGIVNGIYEATEAIKEHFGVER